MSIDLQQFKKLHTSAAKKYMVARGLKPKSEYVTEEHIAEFFASLQEFSEYVEQARENLTTDEARSAFRIFLEKWHLYYLSTVDFIQLDRGGSMDIRDQNNLLLNSLDRYFSLAYDFD
jgi:hypothetical protein